MKIPTQKGEHSCKCTELSLKRKEGIHRICTEPTKQIVNQYWPLSLGRKICSSWLDYLTYNITVADYRWQFPLQNSKSNIFSFICGAYMQFCFSFSCSGDIIIRQITIIIKRLCSSTGEKSASESNVEDLIYTNVWS